MSDRTTALADAYYAAQQRRLSSETETRGPEPETEIEASKYKSEISDTNPPSCPTRSPLRDGEPLDTDEIERLIFALDANVSAIADYLKIRSDRLRAFIYAKPPLKRAMTEVYEGAVDQAVGVLFEGLNDKGSFQNRFYAAKEWLKSDGGRKRGFGKDPGLAASLEVKQDASGGKTIVLKWIEPDAPTPAPMIDGELK